MCVYMGLLKLRDFENMDTTWRESISAEMQSNGDSWGNVEKSTLSEEELDVVFCNGYGLEEGVPFTVWTKDYVYFPASYDGAEWADSVPRNPCDTPKDHV